MKMHGKKIEGPNVEIIVLPRPGGDLVFRAEAVLDTGPLMKLCPMPEPPTVIKRGGAKVTNVEDPVYKQDIENWAKIKAAWMFVTSLRATPELEWETVDYGNPETWCNYQQELKDSGFSEMEVQQLLIAVMNANGMNQTKLDEARERFLSGEAALANGSHSQLGGPSSTPSGEPANASA